MSADVIHEDITVCICTYRRSSLRQAVESVASQCRRVVVIDNEAAGSAQADVAWCNEHLPCTVTYVHAPDRNISIARNAALDAVSTRWLAFLDDDEVAAHDWLYRLAAGSEGNAVVIGQVVAVYGEGLPAWVSALDFHSNRIADTQRVDNAYTSNALIDIDFVRRHDIRFAVECGVTGGEDTLFFRSITRAGGVMAYRAESIVYEDVTPGRATLSWVMRRKFRSGQTHGLMLSRFDAGARRRLPLTAGAKALYAFLRAVLLLPRPQRAIWWLARGALHTGAFAYSLRPRILEEYR